MKIKAIESYRVDMKLSEPYTIAYETVDKTSNVVLRIETSSGLSALGCAAPDLEVTGETADTVAKCVDEVIYPSLINTDPLRYMYLLAKIKPKLAAHPSALAMVDMALLDLMGKHTKLPVYQLLGAYRKSIKTSITIGIVSKQETLEKADAFIAHGFKVLKIKGGKNVEDDVSRVLAIRAKYGKDIEIRFDANQGFSVEDAIYFVENTKKAGVEILEQPTPKDQFEVLGQVTRNVDIPVMADESLLNLRDAFRLAKRDLVDMINIKLMKVGGINEAMHVNSVARAAGYEVMVGCMDESALAISAGLHFALARPNVQYADLDGHLDLIDDPFSGAVILKDGILYPNGNPGLF